MKDKGIQVVLICMDTLVVTLTAVVILNVLSQFSRFHEIHELASHVMAITLPTIALWVFLLVYTGSYRVRQLGGGMAEHRAVLRACWGTAAILGVSAYLLQYPLSRTFFILLFLLGVPALMVERLIMRRVLQNARRHGFLQRSVIVAGSQAHIEDVMRVLEREPWLGYRVVGLLTSDGRPSPRRPDLPVLGTPCNAPVALRVCPASTVIFADGSFDNAHEFTKLARVLESEEVELIVVPSLTDIAAARTAIRPVAGMPMVHVERPQAQRCGSWAKRAFDIVGALGILIIVSPVLAVAAAAIKLSDNGPVWFKQIRVGVGRRPFELYKLRSMVVNAEEIKRSLESDSTNNVLFKMKDDPRITPVGRFIRRFSIDELPQLFNVLRGEMSLVGPRPALREEVAQYDSTAMRRLDVRPGLTGLWQVSGRSNLSWEDTVRLDCYYVDNWSFLQDAHILLRTFKAVFAGSGAY